MRGILDQLGWSKKSCFCPCRSPIPSVLTMAASSSKSFRKIFSLFQNDNPGNKPSLDGGLITVNEKPSRNTLKVDCGSLLAPSHNRSQSSFPRMSLKSDKSSYHLGKNET